ncbi:MAG: MerR family transcriptional regulator [Nitrospirota bacterium]
MKKRYRANEIAKILGVNKQTLFNWEASGKIPKAKRDPMNNYRYYTDEDIEKLKRITGRKI